MNKTIKLKDGRKYTVRADRSRYFFPNEWLDFIKQLKKKNKPLFKFLINTGARIDEALHIRPIDFDFERNNVRFWKTKVKAKKGETVGKVRTISLATKFGKEMKRYCNKFDRDAYIFPASNSSTWRLMRRALHRSELVTDPENFGLHNIRKTHGMWLKSLNIDAAEICLRLGHDMNTYLKHYGSSDIFTDSDRDKMRDILDDLDRKMRR